MRHATLDRTENLRYALQQFELWLSRWEAGQELTDRQIWNIGRAAFNLRTDRGERYDPSDVVDPSETAAGYLERIDPDSPEEDEDGAVPKSDYSLAELRRDVAAFRTTFAYLGNEGPDGRSPRAASARSSAPPKSRRQTNPNAW